MTDLFLDPKVLDYHGDRYQLILYTMRWARALKAKGSAEPMPVLIEKALKDIVEGHVTPQEIMANKVAVDETPKEELPAVVSVADEGESEAKKAAAAAADQGDEKKTKKKKKKEEE